MYLEHFGLGVNPFGLSPKLDFLYKSGTFEESIAHLVYGVDNSEAIVMITGAIGTGKTMSLHSFLANLGPGFYSALVTNTQVDSLGFLKLVLEDLDVEFVPGSDKADLLILFKSFLMEASLLRRRIIIVVDEAQNLAPDVLEELRLLTNLGQGEGQPVQIVLVGQPELEDLVNQPSLAQLRQRIRVHYRLDPLSRREIEEYVDHRMAVAGCREKVFTGKAVDRIFALSGGVPRLVNSLAGSALLAAFVGDRRKVEARDIEDPASQQPETAPRPPFDPGHAPARDPSPAEVLVDEKFAPRDASRSKRTPVLGVLALVILAVVAGSIVLSQYRFELGDIVGNLWPRDDDPVASMEAAADSGPPMESGLVKPSDPEPVVPQRDESLSDTAEQELMEEEPEPVPAVSSVDEEPFFVHVASFREPDRAEAYIDRVHGQGREAMARQEMVFGTAWYRVWLGPFSSEETARTEIARMQSEEKLEYYSLQRASAVPGS